MKKVCAFALALSMLCSMNVSALAEKSETQTMIDWLMNEDTKFEFTPYADKYEKASCAINMHWAG